MDVGSLGALGMGAKAASSPCHQHWGPSTGGGCGLAHARRLLRFQLQDASCGGGDQLVLLPRVHAKQCTRPV